MAESVWHSLRAEMHKHLDGEEFQVWIGPLVPMTESEDCLTLGCPNSFHRQWVRENFLGILSQKAQDLGKKVNIRLEVLPAAETAPAPPRLATAPRPVQMPLPHIEHTAPILNKRYRFDKFVTGAGNEFACAAAKALALGNKTFANTLFLFSGTGLGKSHLTQAVGHQVINASPKVRVAYLTAEDFANQMIAALKRKNIEAFKERFRRGCDVLLLEEVQFLAGKDKTQDELGYTLDALLDAGKRVVFTGSCLPSQVKGLKKGLESRLSSGITAPIEPPDHTTRVRILQFLAAEEGVLVPYEVLEYVAQEVASDVRRLQSALVGLLAKSSLTGRDLDMTLASEVLGQMEIRSRRITPEHILELVSRVYEMEKAVLTGPSRRRNVVRPRNLAMYVCRQHTDASYASLGRIFNRDHATVMYGVEKVSRSLNSDTKLSQELAYLEQRLGVPTY